jgi:hypothetical protein
MRFRIVCAPRPAYYRCIAVDRDLLLVRVLDAQSIASGLDNHQRGVGQNRIFEVAQGRHRWMNVRKYEIAY